MATPYLRDVRTAVFKKELVGVCRLDAVGMGGCATVVGVEHCGLRKGDYIDSGKYK